ncbi:MAG: type II toxin-antitoxin system HicB family antitoxin, partial [Spirochaetota bacterium]|nr:type II toxin-antitoxin system HicB family antitoxin [Spirochaetota bacterium]
VQVPDLAIVSHGGTIDEAKSSAMKAISANLEAYEKAGQGVPERQGVLEHLENPDFADLLFTYVEIFVPDEKINV